jgi:hypothetical protein
MLIEQAIYASCQTSRSSGYQLVAVSPGIAEVDARELTAWGPSHDSLWEGGPAAVSVNFHRLPSGAYCISQTTPAGAEFSHRRGPNVYTQSLVVEPKGLAEFANNPFALLQASIALGHVSVQEKIPKKLEPFWLDPENQEPGKDALDQLVRHPGPAWLGLLLDGALKAEALGIVAGERGACLVSALVQCLPHECRTHFSFTTGLRYSPRRPFRIICLPNNTPENQRLARQYGFSLFEQKHPPPDNLRLGGWASFITAAIASGNAEYLATELARPRESLVPEGLDALGNELAQGLRALQSVPAPPRTVRDPGPLAESSSTRRSLPRPASVEAVAVKEPVDPWQRADGAHRGVPLVAATITGSEEPVVLKIEEEPAQVLARACPAALHSLRQTEDTIFEAMAGKAQALDRLVVLWPKLLTQLGPSRADAARERYLRYAMAVWRQLNTADELADPQRGLHAMEVVSLLFGQDS